MRFGRPGWYWSQDGDLMGVYWDGSRWTLIRETEGETEDDMPPGWFPDQKDPRGRRFWNGSHWEPEEGRKPDTSHHLSRSPYHGLPGWYPLGSDGNKVVRWSGEAWASSRNDRGDFSPSAPAWFPDPEEAGIARWWDGEGWHDHKVPAERVETGHVGHFDFHDGPFAEQLALAQGLDPSDATAALSVLHEALSDGERPLATAEVLHREVGSGYSTLTVTTERIGGTRKPEPGLPFTDWSIPVAEITCTERVDENRLLLVLRAGHEFDFWSEVLEPDDHDVGPDRGVIELEVTAPPGQPDATSTTGVLSDAIAEAIGQRPPATSEYRSRFPLLDHALDSPSQIARFPQRARPYLFATTGFDDGPWPSELLAEMSELWEEAAADAIVDELLDRHGVFWSVDLRRELEDRHPTIVDRVSQLAAQPSRIPARARHHEQDLLVTILISNIGWRRTIERLGLRDLPAPRARRCIFCDRAYSDHTVVPTLLRTFGPSRFCGVCGSAVLGDMNGHMSPEEGLDALRWLAEELGVIPTANICSDSQRVLPRLPEDADRRDRIAAALIATPGTKRMYEWFGAPWPAVLQKAGLIGDTWRPSFGTYCQTLDGEWMRSISEKVVDDFMTRRNIQHEHEPTWPLHPDFNPTGKRRADWRLANGTWIEFAGLLNDESYRSKMDDKRALAAELGDSLLVIEPDDLAVLENRFAGYL